MLLVFYLSNSITINVLMIFIQIKINIWLYHFWEEFPELSITTTWIIKLQEIIREKKFVKICLKKRMTLIDCCSTFVVHCAHNLKGKFFERYSSLNIFVWKVRETNFASYTPWKIAISVVQCWAKNRLATYLVTTYIRYQIFLKIG